MSLQPSSNLFDSFSWLKAFNVAIFDIITNKNYKDFSCYTRLANNPPASKADSAGIQSDGNYWIGFYYFLSGQGRPQPKVSPWFGLWSEDNGNFSIGILIESDAAANNPAFIERLLGNGEHKKFVIHNTNVTRHQQLRCSFNDYMRMGYGERAADSGFSLENWFNSSTTQRVDLEDFFETINAEFLVPHI